MAIKYTADTKKLEKYTLILDDKYYTMTIEKFGKLFNCLQKKTQLSTMKSSLRLYIIYPGISGGNSISDTLRSKTAQIRSRLAAQPKTTITKSLPPPPKQAYFWVAILGDK